jgi:hypothetical protein
MAGLGPAIHDFTGRAKDVDGRHTGGHDEMRQPAMMRCGSPALLVEDDEDGWIARRSGRNPMPGRSCPVMAGR